MRSARFPPAQRHRRTCEIAAEALRQAGGSVPDPVIVDDVDEFDAATVLRRLVPVLVDRDQEVARLYREFRASEDSPEAGRLLQKLFEVVARHWASGEFDIPEVESWENFRGRVSRAIACIRANAPKSSNSVVFTSGGPIAATISLALDLAPRHALELIWVSRNGSYSEFLFSGERFSLSSYNSFPHLDERELLTYR
ncbi:MAG: histidine phosphatase family protein [Acidobacteria bacterium]|nr:histidine phosphatase family protein [Acidobacteriota bacterium]